MTVGAHTLYLNPAARAYAAERRAERDAEDAAILAPAWDPVRCLHGRVYAKRVVTRAAARCSDPAADRRARWC